MATYFAEPGGRERSSKLVGISSLVLTANLAGFNAISYIPGAFGVDHRAITVPFRAMVLLLIFYVAWRLLTTRHLRKRVGVTSILVISFWCAYILRFIFDAAVFEVPLGEPSSEMALYLFGVTLPMFVICYLISDIGFYKRALSWISLILGVCCAVSLHLSSTSPELSASGRFKGNEISNPIGYGHMGVTAVIVGMFIVLGIGGQLRPMYFRLLAAGSVFLGVFSLLAASSRGALVAGALLVPFVLYLGIRRGSKLLTIGICAGGIFVVSVSAEYLSHHGIDLDRLLFSIAGYSSANNSVYGRQAMAREAWNEYLQNPIVGSSIVERDWLTYPHNAVVEAFMATGSLFGSIFALLLLIAAYRAIKLIRRNPSMAWVPLLFFQYLIGAMFSGGLYENVIMWGMMAIMLGVDMPPVRAFEAGVQSADPLISP